ncbi:MAG: acyltransferase [Pirellulaceae bacterium]|nr:acyltransferase [Pirellulaceae bacterium]
MTSNAPGYVDMRRNNFDLLRLFAASQVAYLHVANNLQVELTGVLLGLRNTLEYFPGVPIFFVISGFLISASLDRNPDLRSYAINRFLRIYPGLWASTLVTLLAIVFFGDRIWRAIELSGDSATYIVSKWLAAQVTFAQYYNPFLLKANYGVGHLNGSLWTIPVELQFYVTLPMVVLLRGGGAARIQNGRLIVATGLLFAISWLWQSHVLGLLVFSENLALLVKVSLLPYLYMFMLGIILQCNFDFVKDILTGRGLLWLTFYIAVSWVLLHAFNVPVGTNTPNILSMTILAIAVVSIAFTRGNLSEQILRGNDISYGTYVYHMIVANFAFELGYRGTTTVLAVVLLITYILSIASWVVIEEPALRLKRTSLLSRRLQPLA